MTLREIVKNIDCIIPDKADIEIKGIAYDSRAVKEGYLFVAIKGYETDGHKYIDNAIKNGAVAVLGEDDITCGCTYVKANAREVVLTGQLKKKYNSCSLCDSDAVSIGAFVYCFEENGTVYHKDTCKQVTRYAIEINKTEAVDKGYTPCSKCGGG